nr:hypothetical protein [uncultured Allomuricauda sp.]
MALSNFFKINLPYGIMKNEQGHWSAFNREYKPLGENNSQKHFNDSEYIHTNYGRLSDKFLMNLAGEPGSLKRNDNGEIIKVFFYNDATNPSNTGNAIHWDNYFEKLKMIGIKKVISKK